MSRAIYSKSQKWIPMSSSGVMANTSSGRHPSLFLKVSPVIFNSVEVCEFYEFSLQRCSFLIYMYVRVSQPLWCVFKGLETILVSLYSVWCQEVGCGGLSWRYSLGHIFMNIWAHIISQYLNNIYMSRTIYSKPQKWIPMSGSEVMYHSRYILDIRFFPVWWHHVATSVLQTLR